MKRGKKLIALCMALVVAGGAYGLVRTMTAEPEEEDTGISLAQIDGGNVTALNWTWEGTSLAISREDENWVLTDDPDFPLDQNVPENMLNALYDVTASRQMEAPEGLEEYGLDDPQLTIQVLGEESEWTFSFGDLNDMTSEYYLTLNDDSSTVYLVDSTLYDAFTLALMDMVQMEELPKFETVTGVQVSQPSGSLELFYSEEGNQLCYTGSYSWFLQAADQVYPLDTSKVTDLYSYVTGLTWTSCVDYGVTEDERGQYGLDDSSAVTVTLTYEVTETVDTGETDEDGNAITEEQTREETFVLLLGSDAEEGTYAMLEGSDLVYLISTDTADALRYAAYSGLRPDQICAVEWDGVELLEVTVSGETYAISFDGTEEVETTDEDGETYTEEVDHYSLDGEELDADQVSELLGAISNLTMTGEGTAQGQSEMLISFTVYQDSDAFPQVTLTLYAYDAASCLVSFQGEAGQLVSRSEVNELVSLAEAFLNE